MTPQRANVELFELRAMAITDPKKGREKAYAIIREFLQSLGHEDVSNNFNQVIDRSERPWDYD